MEFTLAGWSLNFLSVMILPVHRFHGAPNYEKTMRLQSTQMRKKINRVDGSLIMTVLFLFIQPSNLYTVDKKKCAIIGPPGKHLYNAGR